MPLPILNPDEDGGQNEGEAGEVLANFFVAAALRRRRRRPSSPPRTPVFAVTAAARGPARAAVSARAPPPRRTRPPRTPAPALGEVFLFLSFFAFARVYRYIGKY